MRFNPLSEKELAELNIIPIGTYDFHCVDAENAKSKSGNDMIKLKLKIFDSNGHERIIFDYLLEAMMHKLKHFADVTGLEQKYESGTICAEDCIGKSGTLELTIQKDKTGQYPDRNAVKDYVVKTKPIRTVDTSNDFINDEIPF